MRGLEIISSILKAHSVRIFLVREPIPPRFPILLIGGHTKLNLPASGSAREGGQSVGRPGGIAMLRKSLAVLICAALTTIVSGQTTPPALTNDDVVAMFKGGLGESTIISAVRSQETNFDISAKGLLELKKGGIPPQIMDEVISAAGKHKAAVEAAAAKAEAEADAKAKASIVAPAVTSSPILPGTPSVLMIQAGQKQPLSIGRTQIVQTKTKPSSLAALTSDETLAQAMGGVSQSIASAGIMKGSSKIASTAMMANPMISGAMLAGGLFAFHYKSAVTDVWAVPGPKSETMIHNAQPAFEVHYDNIPGINADEYEPVLLKLESTTNNFRLVGATEAKQDALQSSTADWGIYSSFVEERIPAQATKAASGSYQLQAGSALPPGEYAVALRPINKEKKFSGTSMTQNTGDGLFFNSVWSFEVQ